MTNWSTVCRKRLNGQVPGVAFAFTQPIEMRVEELVAGVKADVAVLVYGDDLDVLNRTSKEIERVLKNIDGARMSKPIIRQACRHCESGHGQSS